MNAIDLLKNDHDRVIELFDNIESAEDRPAVRRLYRQIKQKLELHTQIEESTFYPALEKRPEFKEMIDLYYDDHEEIREIFQEMESATDEQEWDERLDELMDVVEGHIDDEENELFPKIAGILAPEELESLGVRLAEAKRGTTSGIAA